MLSRGWVGRSRFRNTSAPCRFLSAGNKPPGVAIVSGGSSGIGLRVVRRLMEEGWLVHNISRSVCPVPGIRTHSFDLTCVDEARGAARSVVETMGGAESRSRVSFIHCASVFRADSIKAFNVKDMRDSLNINVIAPGVILDSIRPFMKEGSSVILIGSTLSEKAVAGRCSYITSKHATDLFGSGIHTVCVCPGFTDTPMLQREMKDEEQAKKFFKQFVSLGRMISPEEVAESIFHAVNMPALNGSILHLNGGQKETYFHVADKTVVSKCEPNLQRPL
ncbi:hypothetical protein GUITHDRAFT_147559 [Guillardia theta CCMP2712]|uniref:Uncharacterized protein n=1 Tax=Guillardia theta (strain CCMP2712) TaxID=905079 RepID=L1IDE1_GUITC|nr:hypothetical protein GUITHDRAFT_147559 [Guillardia theta CCMP2712]EKX33929.1 hypothetical protein GUITHDRAFT_147559 [Guillardia theta CCMP2712]|eukprot:XP_005820909.1 hypothetical protein GUITHDRAFT_147559 [Guillardia theta CCMP2712]